MAGESASLEQALQLLRQGQVEQAHVLLDRSDSPWYSTVHLFRQPRVGDWSTVFNDMANSLELLVPGRLAVRQA